MIFSLFINKNFDGSMNLQTNFNEDYDNTYNYNEENYKGISSESILLDNVDFQPVSNMFNIFELEGRNSYVLVAFGVTFFYFNLLSLYLFYHFVWKKKICARYKAMTPKKR